MLNLFLEDILELFGNIKNSLTFFKKINICKGKFDVLFV